MSVFVQATPAPTPKTDRITTVATLYAVILVGMAVTQLYTFDTFIELFPSYGATVEIAGYLLAPLIIIAEVLALPFLLRMRLSPAFRFLSMVSGWLVAAAWFSISLWLATNVPMAETVGFLGTLGALIPGWWAVLLSVSFGILAAWASWGMWPLHQRKK